MGKKPSKKGFDLERIDKLLAQFPDEDPDTPTSAGPPGRPAPQPGPPQRSGGTLRTANLPPRNQRIGSWIRVAAGLVLAFGITQWPYAHACGLGLLFYLAAVAGIVAVGVWAGVHTWRSRLAVPHLLAQCVLLWGLALAVFLILPRVGYAKTEAIWLCRVQTPVPSPAVDPVAVEPTSPQEAALSDSAAAGDSTIAADSLASLDPVVKGDSVTRGDSVPVAVPDTSSGGARTRLSGRSSRMIPQPEIEDPLY